MKNEELKPIVDKIITDAFNRIDYAYQHNREKTDGKSPSKGFVDLEHQTETRLVFPRYANNGTRISEQELRFAFVEAFNASDAVKEHNLFYSIETPTEKRYKGFSSGQPEQHDSGRSGEFDMVILDKDLNRVCYIEFKANNANKSDHWKDILKLKEEGKGHLCYFIEVLKSFDNATQKSLKEDKFASFFNKKEHKKYEQNGAMINVRCYALEGERKGQTTEGKGSEISFEKTY